MHNLINHKLYLAISLQMPAHNNLPIQNQDHLKEEWTIR